MGRNSNDVERGQGLIETSSVNFLFRKFEGFDQV